MKRILKLSYICLLITMIYISISSLSFNVYAKIQNDSLEEHQIYSDYKSEIKEKSINLNLFEIETLREESVKHFRLEDGTYRAVSYGRKVHQLDSNNKWIDFDNTLTLNNGYYKTTDNNLSFIKNINLNKPIVNFINEDYSLLLYIQSEQKLNAVEADVENNSVFYDSIRNKTIDDLINENKNSTIKYNNICDGVSLEYFLEYDKFNTKIKIESYDRSIPIRFLVETDNVNIIVNNGSLEFYNKSNNILIKRLNKPIVNTNDETNIDLSYNTYSISKNSYIIELTESINNLFETKSNSTRYIPDLDIEIGDGNTGPTYPIQDTYISSTSPSTYYGRYSYLKITDNPSEIALINVSVPYIPSNNTITEAYMTLPYYFNSTSNHYMVVGAYSILGNWNEYYTNWNNAPSISTTKICEKQITCNATSSNVKTVNFDLTEISQSWYANEITNYGIAFKYERGSSSSMYVKSVDANNGYPDYIISYQDDSLIEDGTYFIKNGELENFLQIDDADSSNNYNSNNAMLEMWEYDGNNYQKWDFEYLHNGYYIIKSKCSGKVISVPQGNEDELITLVQQPYTGSYNQQWKISLSSHGMYILKARSSESYETNRVMCVGDNITSNGRRVKQREYENNNYYKDEWIICNVDYSLLMAIDEGLTNPRHSYFDETKSNLEMFRNGLVSVVETVRYTSLDVDEMIDYMQNANILFVHTHGSQWGFEISVPDEQQIMINDLRDVDLENISLAVLLTCNTGNYFNPDNIATEDPANIIEQMVICGAETVIGFSGNTYISDCNKFAIALSYQLIIEGDSVFDAINNIDYHDYDCDGNFLDYIVIAGNQNNTLR